MGLIDGDDLEGKVLDSEGPVAVNPETIVVLQVVDKAAVGTEGIDSDRIELQRVDGAGAVGATAE